MFWTIIWTMVKVYLIYVCFSWFVFGTSLNALEKARYDCMKKQRGITEETEEFKPLKKEYLWKIIVENYKEVFRLSTRK